ncbi:hypothetical protein [Cytobacillus oceanisediminis]|uniref:hypothetical protein n=1 Tax=Cytobacillus oceanisediminis TaxID=665099 RepID=UPI001C219B0B|nr:hypothetical protein [Cytobacillus oceanisediminis]MBU8770322.1 hypothetical protein [Cytobacillus oceanisediminis]
MSIQKAHLDMRICDVEGSTNEETFREFIRNTEKEFELDPAPLDELTAIELNEYLEFLDDMWLK